MLKPLLICLAIILVGLTIRKVTEEASHSNPTRPSQASIAQKKVPRPRPARKFPDIPLKWTGDKHAVNPNDELSSTFCEKLEISELERAKIDRLLKTLRLDGQELMLAASTVESTQTGEIAVIGAIEEAITELERDFLQELKEILDSESAAIVAHQVKLSELITSGKPERVEWSIDEETHDFTLSRGSRKHIFRTSELPEATPQQREEALSHFGRSINQTRSDAFLFNTDHILQRVQEAARDVLSNDESQ